VGVALLPFVGCGGSSDDDGGASSTSLDDLPALYAESTCKVVKGCLGPVYDLFLGGESCEDNYATAFNDELPRLKASIDAGLVEYDGTKVSRCLAEVEAAGCTTNDGPAVCNEVLTGSVEMGGDCELSAECAGTDSYCKVDSSCPGSCALKEQAGSDCKRDGDCADGLTCSDDTSKCVKPAAAGQACGGTVAPDCAFGTFCVGADEQASQAGTCKSTDEAFSAKAGEACFVDAAPLCEAGLSCLFEIDVAAQALKATCGESFASGAACQVGIPDPCPVDQFCKAATNSVDGTCTPRPGQGEPCEAQFDSSVCATNLRCDGGTCKPRQHLGGTCSDDDVCYSNNCLNGGCAPGAGCG
jgi:hypothetical protein